MAGGSKGAGGAIVAEASTLPHPFDFQDLEGLLALAGNNAATLVCAEEAGVEEVAEKLDLCAQAGALPPQAHDTLWQQVLAVAGEYLRTDRLLSGPDGEVDETTARVVRAVATLLDAFTEGALDASRCPALPEAFVQAAGLCQEMLLSVPDGQTQALIARSLERVCTDAFEGREDFYGGVLMFLIGKCLSPKIAAADVTRLYKVRDLLPELDWEHESIESLKMQLLLCVRSPNFVRCQHGPDMISLFYVLHPGFTAEVHSTVKSQVVCSRPAALKAYSVSLYKAWKISDGGARIQMEHCVQDWVSMALRTARKSADSARVVLEEFHRHHHDQEQVNELLCRLYGPLLWRSLKVANSQVRENAARLLQYTFPLLPKELGVADKEQELAKQLRLVRESLEDPSEPVRRVGVSAVCVILKNYWEMLPPGGVAEILNVVMSKCAHDKKAPMVRAAVAEGLGWILDNPLAHPTLGAVLPNLSELLNDRSPLVRVAFVKLLQAVSLCRGLQVSSLVNHEDLLLRLASEHTEGQAERLQKGAFSTKKSAATTAASDTRGSPDQVAKQLARLLAPSIFNQDLVQQVIRCQYLMQHWPLALLALLSHIQDITPAPERVKLAAALFRYGLREAAGAAAVASAGAGPKSHTVATMLRVVGVLLEGAAEPAKKSGSKKKAVAARARFPKELEKFVYDHIKEEDFVHLLRASHEEGGAAERLLDDLFFALSPLDPAKLPQTAELVRHELTMACRGGAAPASTLRLMALLRTAVRWGILGTSLDPAWERLLAAASRLKQRQPTADDTANAVLVVEAAFRDTEVRSAVLPLKAKVLGQIVQAISGAFCESWSSGLAELRRPAASGGVPLLLGPAAGLWPQILGLIMRIALHLDHRVPSPTAACKAALALQDGCAVDGEAFGEDAAMRAAEAAPDEGGPAAAAQPLPTSLAEATLEALGQAMAHGAATEVLDALEAIAAAQSGGDAPPPAKKRSKGIALPADVDTVLQVYERLLEALNAAYFLLVLRQGASSLREGAGAPLLARELEECFWRWACAADLLRPLEEGSRVAESWVLLGRLLQQMSHTEVPTPDVVEAARRLLCRVSAETPADNAELRKVLQALFSQMQFEPQLVQLVASVLGPRETEQGAAHEELEDNAEISQLEYHPRVKAVVMELIPSFRNLRAKFMPKDQEEALPVGEPETPGTDRRRVLMSPTPQKAGGLGALEVPSRAPRQSDLRLLGGEESPCSESRMSLGHRSFSVRSRSPPPPMPDITDEEMDFEDPLSEVKARRHSYTEAAAACVASFGSTSINLDVD